MQAVLLFLVATAASSAASHHFRTVHGRAAVPGAAEECCQDGVPVCSELSRRLRIPDLGCELLCRSQGHAGSLGCSYRPPVPACGCRNERAPAGVAATSTTPAPEPLQDFTTTPAPVPQDDFDATQPDSRALRIKAPPPTTLSRVRFP